MCSLRIPSMSSKRSKPLAALLAFAFVAPAYAGPGGAYFTSPFTVGVTRESNFIVNGVALQDNVLLVLPPTLSLLSMGPRGEIALSYQPELEAFTTYHDLTSVNHSADLLLSHRLNPRLTFSAGDSFVSTSDPSRRV